METIRDLKTKYRIIDLVQVIASILSIISFVFSFFSFKAEKITLSIFFIITTLFFFSILMFFLTLKFRKLSLNRLKSFSSQFHHFTHLMRDTHYDLLNQYKNDKLNSSYVNKVMEDTLKSSLDYLCNILNNSTGKDVSSCIKIIEAYTSMALTKDNAFVRTLCRDSNSNSSRANDKKPCKIADNTDFAEILFDQEDCFHQQNLIEYEKLLDKAGGEYKNSNTKWSKFYKSTIVCPIRIHNKLLHYRKTNADYSIIGFLCVDSMSTGAFRNSDKTRNSNIVKAFADEIFVFCEQCRFFLEKVS